VQLIKGLSKPELLALARNYDNGHKGLVGQTHNPYWDELQRREVERSTLQAMVGVSRRGIKV